MQKYLGEFPVDIAETCFKDYTPSDWAMRHITRMSGIDGSHHQKWILDQVARYLKGGEVTVVEARWEKDDGSLYTEYRVSVGESDEYREWVKSMLGEWNEDDQEYEYDIGSPP